MHRDHTATIATAEITPRPPRSHSDHPATTPRQDRDHTTTKPGPHRDHTMTKPQTTLGCITFVARQVPLQPSTQRSPHQHPLGGRLPPHYDCHKTAQRPSQTPFHGILLQLTNRLTTTIPRLPHNQLKHSPKTTPQLTNNLTTTVIRLPHNHRKHCLKTGPQLPQALSQDWFP